MIREMKKISTVMKNNDKSYELASEDESVESEDASSSNEDDIAQNSAESSDDEASNEGDSRNRVNCVRQRAAR